MHPSTAELVRRIGTLPDTLRSALLLPLPDICPEPSRVILTGIGASEAIARFAEATWQHHFGMDVRVEPVSACLSADNQRARHAPDTVRILLSQGLSPNAALALHAHRNAPGMLLLTSLPASDPRIHGMRVWTLPPAAEDGFLVRAVGPMVTALALVRLGAALSRRAAPELDVIPDRVAAALQTGRALTDLWPQAFDRGPLLATGWYARALEPLAWTWMEAWFVEAPPIYDVLQLVHGPWQAHWGGRSPILRLRRPDDPEGLWERLDAMQREAPARPNIDLTATLTAPLAFFEHFAMVLGLLTAVLERHGGDLRQWPGHGTDEPLYGIGR